MTTIAVDVRLHSPARIATGRPERGLDAVLDHHRLPASSLKGLMRAAAREILGLDRESIASVYGSPTRPSPWAWSDLRLPEDDTKQITTRVRIPIDPGSGVAKGGGMFHAEELWLSGTVTFTIEQIGEVADVDHDTSILAASAMAVKGIGASRRRGMGWTTWQPSVDGRPIAARTLARTVTALQGGVDD